MNADTFERIAAERLVDRKEVAALCRTTGKGLEAILDDISLRMAKRYLCGEISFTYADSVMNGLHDVILFGRDGSVASDFAWEVFLAFDEGEYRHRGDGPEIDPEQKYTRPLVLETLKKYKK